MSRDLRNESGVSLVLVLVLVVVFGLLIPVLGQLGSASGVATHVVKSQRFDELAAESSVQAAIAWARTTRTAGRDSVACPDFNAKFPRDDGFSRNVTVKCQGFQGSGKIQEGPNIPTYALLTTATGSSEIGVDVAGGGAFRTGGPLWSNSGTPGGAPSIAITNVDLDNHDDLVGGAGPCQTQNARVFGAPELCNSGTVVDDPGGPGDPTSGDPTYGKWASSVQSISDVPLRAIPTDPCGGIPSSRVFALQPGYYHDVAGLDALTNQSSPNFCGDDVVLWLQPGPADTVGKFYFDFDFFESNGLTWRMNSAPVVGGVPSGWDPEAGSSQVARVRSLIRGDETRSCDTTRNGVELVFGHQSRIRFRSPAELELCPIARGATEVGQAISIYGRKTGDAPQTLTSSNPIAARPSVTDGAFDWPDALPNPSPLTVRDCPSAGACAPESSMSGTLTGNRAVGTVRLRVPFQVPEGVRLDEFTIAVTHRETEAEAGDLADLHLDIAGLPPGYTCDVSDIGTSIDEWSTDSATCTAGEAPTNAAAGPDFFASLSATNGDRDGATSSVEVDYVQVIANYTEPALRAQSGCILEPEGRGGCGADEARFIDVDAGSDAAIHVWGTVYAPGARVYADFQNRSAFRFGRGAVLRSFEGHDVPTSPPFAAFSLPTNDSYAGRFVAFEAFVDGEAAEPVLRARVYFCESLNPDGTWDDRCPDQPPRAPRITTWTVGR